MTFILVVDANEALAVRASDALIAAGHACGWVNDGDKAIALLRWRAPDLVLLDRDADGAEYGHLPQALRRAAGRPGLPIILLAAASASAATDEYLDREVLDCIGKPFDPRFLVWRVNHALEESAARPLRASREHRPAMAWGDSLVREIWPGMVAEEGLEPPTRGL